jgi:hypothetical protein
LRQNAGVERERTADLAVGLQWGIGHEECKAATEGFVLPSSRNVDVLAGEDEIYMKDPMLGRCVNSGLCSASAATVKSLLWIPLAVVLRRMS